MKVMLAAVLLLAGCSSMQRVEATDPELKATIMTALQAEPDLDLRYVTVDVHQRAVTLSGLAANYEERQKIFRIARDTPGVEQVLLNLVVQE